MFDFENLRKKYPEFIYKSYSVSSDSDWLNIKYEFEITGLCSFSPEWHFPLKEKQLDIDSVLLSNMVFSLGMVELVSYWKATCSPNVKILPHAIDTAMVSWWKELYFGGLGEFFYTNGIKTDRDTFMSIESFGKILLASSPLDLNGNLVPVGGGKDSAVTLRILKRDDDVTVPYIINSRGATENTCIVAGYEESAYRVRRTIDKNLIELNKQGFLNGHTPFSAIVAFSSLIAAVINGKKYVVLSNESSANESTVAGESINHQFSKGEEFEKSFIEYQKKYINSGVEYFSLLRPLSEMQIAALFAKYNEYHKIFRSCNVGSKKDIWCCNCPKCLFVYIILSPFLSTDELISIFGENLLDKDSLLDTYKELLGVLPNKPFECVGSRDEVVTASRYTYNKLCKTGEKIPKLLEYFSKDVNINCSGMSYYENFFDKDNHLPRKFLELLQSELKEHISNVSTN